MLNYKVQQREEYREFIQSSQHPVISHNLLTVNCLVHVTNLLYSAIHNTLLCIWYATFCFSTFDSGSGQCSTLLITLNIHSDQIYPEHKRVIYLMAVAKKKHFIIMTVE